MLLEQMQTLRDPIRQGYQNLPNTGSVDISSLVHFKAAQYRGLSALRFGVRDVNFRSIRS